MDPSEVERACRGVSDFIATAVTRYPIDERRVLMAGFSQGGFIAYQVALRDPARFAGLLALSSWLPAELASDIVTTPAHAQLSTFVVHGLDDPMISIERGRESRDALLALGVPTVYREFAMGHEISPEALRTIVAWVDERVFPRLAVV